MKSILCVLLMLIGPCLYAQWEELPSQGTTIDFGGIFNDKSAAFSGTAIHAGNSYWVGIDGSQVSAEENVISQDLAARLQGGLGFYGFSLQAFVEANRDIQSDFALSSGSYIRKVVELDKLSLIFGAGSLVERDDVKEELGLDNTSPDVLPYWLAILGAKYNFSDTIDFYGKLVGKPEISLGSFEGGLTIGTDIILKENLTLKIRSDSEVILDSSEFSVSKTENSILLSINY